jgi:pilus assembly protein Flp/PilA
MPTPPQERMATKDLRQRRRELQTDLENYEMNIKQALVALWKGEEGLTVVEYAIAGGLIGAAVIAAFLALGGTVSGIINYINTQLIAGSPAV